MEGAFGRDGKQPGFESVLAYIWKRLFNGSRENSNARKLSLSFGN
jgi:hypothetical protein